MTNEPRFRIVGNEVKEQSRVEVPQIADYYNPHTRGVSAENYQRFWSLLAEYNEHLATLRTYIASPELKERFGDNEFGEKDIKVTEGRIKDDDQIYWIAYPVSQEQESQEDLWEQVISTVLSEKVINTITKTGYADGWYDELEQKLKQHYTITKNK
jgi:hypothetical protein